MKNHEINIRDPFVLVECDTYYMYGTRAKDFGRFVGGVDVYISKDLENWSEPFECFNAVHQIFVLYRKAVLKHTPFPNLCHRILMQFFSAQCAAVKQCFPQGPGFDTRPSFNNSIASFLVGNIYFSPCSKIELKSATLFLLILSQSF